MEKWIAYFNEIKLPETKQQAVCVYASLHTTFVSIHPFYDGNGRMGRLLANIPVIKSGFPPITLSAEHRSEYIKILGKYQADNQLEEPAKISYTEMENFIEKCWETAYSYVESAKSLQAKRNNGMSPMK